MEADNKYNNKHSPEEQILINKLKGLLPDTEERCIVRKKLFAALHKNYSVKELWNTPKALLELQHKDAFSKRQEVLSKQIIRELKTLNPEKRKEEIRDKSLSYLFNTFVSDTDKYFFRNKWLLFPDQHQVTFTSEDYISQRNDIIDAMPFDLINLSDREVIELFSTFTSHAYDPSIMNPIVYHNQAIAYIPELKQVFKKAKPVVLPWGITSEKIIELPTPAGENMLLEFKYKTTAIDIRKQQQKIRLRIHKPEHLKQVLNNDIEEMEEKIESLNSLHIKWKEYIMSHSSCNDIRFWKEISEEIVNDSTNLSSWSSIQDSVRRLERVSKKPINNIPAYKNFVEGLITTIRHEKDSLIVKQHEIQKYKKSWRFNK